MSALRQRPRDPLGYGDTGPYVLRQIEHLQRTMLHHDTKLMQHDERLHRIERRPPPSRRKEHSTMEDTIWAAIRSNWTKIVAAIFLLGMAWAKFSGYLPHGLATFLQGIATS